MSVMQVVPLEKRRMTSWGGGEWAMLVCARVRLSALCGLRHELPMSWSLPKVTGDW